MSLVHVHVVMSARALTCLVHVHVVTSARALVCLIHVHVVMSGHALMFLQVRALEDQNKMNALNLAIVFGPNLIWSTDEVASLVGLGEINGFVHFMINHRMEIFTKTRN